MSLEMAVETACVICLTSFTASGVQDEIDKAAVIFDSFFRAERLVRLREELEKIRALVEETENFVKDTIVDSEKQCRNANSPAEDFRFRVVRDLIVGPAVRVEKIEVTITSGDLPEIKVEPTSDEEINEFSDHDSTIQVDNFLDVEMPDIVFIEDIQGSSGVTALKSGRRPRGRPLGTTKGKNRTRNNKWSKSKKKPVNSRRTSRSLKTEKRLSDKGAAENICMLDVTLATSTINEDVLTKVGEDAHDQRNNQEFGDSDGEFGDFETREQSSEFGDVEVRRNAPRSTRPKKLLEIAISDDTMFDDEPIDGNEAADEKTDKKSSHGSESDDDEDDDFDAYEDDPYDEDFILPDDTVQTMAADEKLGKKVISSLQYYKRAGSEKKRAPRFQPKLTTLEENRFLYDNKYEFSGNDETGYKCALCEKRKFGRKRLVLSHIREIHMGRGKRDCDICGKLLSSLASYKAHMETHANETVICESCGKVFGHYKLLRCHIKYVHDSETEVCETCGKTYKNKTSLNSHIRSVHQKLKRCYCEVCGKGFFSHSALKMHGSSHTSDKPFECQYCGQRLNRQVHLKRHIRQFHEPVSTPETSMMNTVKTNSSSEMSVPSANPEGDADGGDPSLKCKLCGLQYNRQNNLTRHLLQIHHINVKGVAWKCRSFKKKIPDVSPSSGTVSEAVAPDPSLSQGSGSSSREPVNLHRDMQLELARHQPGNLDLPPPTFEPTYYHGLNVPISTGFPVVPNDIRALAAYSHGVAGIMDAQQESTAAGGNSRPSAMYPFNINRNLL